MPRSPGATPALPVLAATRPATRPVTRSANGSATGPATRPATGSSTGSATGPASLARRGLGAALALLLVGPAAGARAGEAVPDLPPVIELPPAAPRRAEWEAAGQPLVLIVPDHLGLDARAAHYGRALRAVGLGTLELPLPPWPDPGGWGRVLPAAPERPGAAEAILPALLRALERRAAPGRRIGVLGFGPGGEAALLAAHAATLGGTAARFAAHAALYPSCAGPLLPRLRAMGAATTGAPVLAILPHAGGAGDLADGCGPLFDGWAPQRPEALHLLAFDSLGYGFDLWPATALEAMRGDAAQPAPDPLRFDVLRTGLAREALVRFFRQALLPGQAVAGGRR